MVSTVVKNNACLSVKKLVDFAVVTWFGGILLIVIYVLVQWLIGVIWPTS